MPICFVIQPFTDPYNKRYESLYKPAIEAAGMEAYRVDQDPTTTILINDIEENIKSAAVCLADITEDNPNVWYELGFAFAAGRPVVMACAEDRHKNGHQFPFDIRHRPIVTYKNDAPPDFESFKDQLTSRLSAMLARGNTLAELSEKSNIAEIDGLTPQELHVLSVAASNATEDSDPVSLWTVRDSCERSGLNNLGINIGLRRLKAKGFVQSVDMFDEHQAGGPYPGIQVTEPAWQWIESNESKFSFHTKQPNNVQDMNDDIPF